MANEMSKMPSAPASEKLGEKPLASNEKLLAKEEEPKKGDNKIHVVATRVGFFKQRRIKVGDKFTLDNAKQFSESWMKKI